MKTMISLKTTKSKIQGLIRANSIPEPNTGCWLWVGGVTNNDREYASMYLEGYTLKVSRLALYAFGNFDLNSKLSGLHKCNVKLCVNYTHLYPGTQLQNAHDNLRAGTFCGGFSKNKNKTHCPRGHEYIGKNLFVNSKGARECRKCIRVQKVKYYEKIKMQKEKKTSN